MPGKQSSRPLCWEHTLLQYKKRHHPITTQFHTKSLLCFSVTVSATFHWKKTSITTFKQIFFIWTLPKHLWPRHPSWEAWEIWSRWASTWLVQELSAGPSAKSSCRWIHLQLGPCNLRSASRKSALPNTLHRLYQRPAKCLAWWYSDSPLRRRHQAV